MNANFFYESDMNDDWIEQFSPQLVRRIDKGNSNGFAKKKSE